VWELDEVMMTTAARNEGTTPTELAVILFGVMLLTALSVAAYQRFRIPINGAWLHLIQIQVSAFCWIDGSQAQALYRWASRISPAQLQWDDMIRATSLAGRWMRWVNVAILVPLAAIVWHYTDRARLFRRTFNARDLLARNIHLFPCIAPALRKNLLKAPMHRGPWAIAMSPTWYVAQHALLLDRQGRPVPRSWLITAEGLPNEESPLQRPDQNGVRANAGLRLDRERARKLLSEQLGERFAGICELAPHRKALAVAFIVLAHAQRARAQSLLDQLSISFREAKEGTAESFQLNTAGVHELLTQFPITQSIKRRLHPHSAYTLTWMVALLECARERGGQLPSCEFLWLRPVDRVLWYALNQTGGRVPWTETAGVWAHYEAETVLGMALKVPEVESAVDALQSSLIANGWLPGETAPQASPGNPRPFASGAA
jgi:intracellular multiplication protein IcmP